MYGNDNFLSLFDFANLIYFFIYLFFLCHIYFMFISIHFEIHELR